MNVNRGWMTKLIFVFAIFIIGCSGGGGDGGIDGSGLNVEGTAAVGEPLANAEIIVKGANGNKKRGTTDANGKFKINVNGLTAPYLLKVNVDSGKRLYSIAPEKGVNNIHPISDVVARNWFKSRDRDIDAEFDSDDAIDNPPLSNEIAALITALKNLLIAAYQEFSVDGAFNFQNSRFDADGTEFDRLLDHVLINIKHDRITIKLVDPDEGFQAIIILNFDLSNDLSDPDTVPPTAPSGLVAFPVSDSQVVLVWNPASDNVGVAGYRVYRSDDAASFPVTTAFPVLTDSVLDSNTEYCYTVEAFDGAGQVSPMTPEVCVTPQPVSATAPEAVTDLVAVAESDTEVALSWTPSVSDDVIGYDILRGPQGQVSEKIATVVPSSYDDFNLTPETQYCYIVRAFGPIGLRSADSAEICATTTDGTSGEPDTTAPQSSANLPSGTYATAQTVSLSCDDGANGSGCAAIYYTTDGSEPTTDSSVYASPIELNSDTTLRFFATDNAGNAETVNQQDYIISLPPSDTTAPVTSASPIGGSFNAAQSVTLTCDDGSGSGCAAIYFTTDGSTPTTSSTVYTTPINISSDTTLRFFAMDNAGNAESPNQEGYIITIPPSDTTAPATSANPVGGTYNTAQSVVLTCDDGAGSGCAAIYFTTDGSTPTTSSAVYTAPINISGDTTLRFFAMDNAGNAESPNQEDYIIDTPDITAPVTSANPVGGTYNSAQSVALTCDDGGGSGCATIFYTTDGSEPTISSTVYTSPINISTNTTLRFVAIDNVGNQESSTANVEEYIFVDSLVVDVSVLSNPVEASGKVFYAITVNNVSFAPVNNVNVTYQIPTGLSFNGNPDAQPNVACGGNFACNAGEQAVWVFASIPAGGSETIHINADVDAGLLTGDSITAAVSVTAAGISGSIDINKTVEVNNSPSAQLAISADRDPVMPGETYRLLLDFGNTSGGILTGTELRAFLPAGVTVVDTDGGFDAGGGEIVWDLSVSPIGVGAALHREVTITAPALPGAMSTDIHKATAQLTFDGGAAVDVVAEHAVSVLDAGTVPLLFDVSTARSPAVADKKLYYTFTVSNDSFQPLNNVTVLYRIPEGVSFDGNPDAAPNVACGGNFSCLVNEEAAWNVGTIPAGGSVSINLNADVALGTLNGTLLRAPIRVVADELDDTMSLVHTVAVDNTEDAQLSLTADRDPVMPDETYRLLLDFGNISGGVLTGAELRAFLPAGVTVVDTDGGFDAGGGEIVWDLSVSPIGVGAALHREVVVTAPALPGSMSTDIHKASAQLTFDGGAEVDVVAEHAVTVLNENTVPLLFDVSTARSPAIAGNKLYYTFTVSNDSFVPLNNVTVLYRIPEGVSFSGNQDAQPDVACGGNFACNPNEEAAWNVGTIPAGGSMSINLNADVALGMLNGDLLSAPIRVVADELADTMSLVHTVAVDNTEDAQLSLSADRDPVMPGETYQLLLDFGNTSGGVLTGTELRAFLPAGVTVVATDGGTNTGTGEVFWTLGNMTVGEALHREITITAPDLPVTVSTDIHKASAQLTFDGGAEVDVVAEHAVTVLNDNTVPLLFDVSTVRSPAITGNKLYYAFTVSNDSFQPLNNVTVLYRIPEGVSFDGNPDAQPNVACGGNFTCNPNEEAAWNVGTIPAGGSVSININADVALGMLNGDLLSAPIRVVADELADTMSLIHTVAVDNTEDAQLSLSADRDPVMPGENYTLLLDLGNISGGQLTGSELRLFLPAGSTVVNAGGGTDTGAGEIFWNLGNIAIGNSQHFEVTITAPALPVIVSTDIHKASAQLTFDGGAEVDVVAEHAVTVLDGTPELTVSVSATPVPVAAGGVLSYTITVSNTSAVAINNVSLVYRIPANVSFSGNNDATPIVACGGNFACQEGEEAAWTFTSIAGSSSEVITINASVAGGLMGGTLISASVIGTADEMSDTISISYSVPVQ